MMRISDSHLGALLAIVYISFGCITSAAYADSFNDAVNLYLKGFDDCTAAKDALTSGNSRQATKLFAQYKSTLSQASVMDESILTSSKRGMSSNLKYCERVGIDIEQAQSEPILKQAFAACDAASDHLKASEYGPAQEQYQQFLTLRDQAQAVAPSIQDVFSIRSKIRLCERMERKIANAGKKLEAVTVAQQAAMDASDQYAVSCKTTEDALKKPITGAQSIPYLEGMIVQVKAEGKEADSSLSKWRSLAGTAIPAEFENTQKKNAQSDQCVEKLAVVLSGKKQLWQKQQALTEGWQKELVAASQQCDSIIKLKSVNKSEYDQARRQFQSARSQYSKLKSDLSSAAFKDNVESKKLNDDLAQLNQCLDKARPHLGTLLATIAVPVVKPKPMPKAAPKAAPEPTNAEPKASVAVAPPSSSKKTSVPASALSGVLSIQDILPEFVVLYWQDGSKSNDQIDVDIHPTSFDSKVYFLAPSGSIKLNSNDFATHTISATVPGSETVKTKVRSRQRKTVSSSWPENTIAHLKSDQDRVDSSYIVNLNAQKPELLYFENDKDTLKVSLKNPEKASRAVLLMPDYDPVVFDIGSGEEKTLDITRNGIPLGSLSIKGM